MINSKTVIAIPPGETIREQLEMRGMAQREFAARMALSEKHVSHLVNGRVELTKDIALRLESVLGLPASFWNNIESIYREKLSRVIAENEMEEEKRLVTLFPFAEMVTLGWVRSTKKVEEKVVILRSFFEVAKLHTLDTLKIPGIAFRKTGDNTKNDYSLAAWAQKARLEARDIKTSPMNIAKLSQNISDIRKMTAMQADEGMQESIELLSECGVALVLLDHLKGSHLHGATFYDGNRIVMGLTVRGRHADIFWFSLFHELCHIVKGHISEALADQEHQENEADDFAKDTLIPKNVYSKFVKRNVFTRSAIVSFAKEIDIASDIVLGRLQRDNYVSYDVHSDLRRCVHISKRES